MIGETGTVIGYVNSERIARDSQVEAKGNQQTREPEVEQQELGVTDEANFSPEALALARNIPGVEATSEQEQTGAGTQEQQQENPTSRFLDIRA